MSVQPGTRLLFLDDSGHPAPNYGSDAVVIGGVAIASGDVAALNRCLLGAKARFFPGRGQPSGWEIKAADTIRPNRWKRSKNRALITEVVRILRRLDCTTYTATITKSHMKHAMSQHTTMPLQIQCLVEHFAVECNLHGEVGAVVMDRSDHVLDAHASRCAASYIASQDLPLHPGVYYADSVASQAIQAADLVAGTRRRAVEGDRNLQALARTLAALRPAALTGAPTHTERPWTNEITLF
ncbi:MAG: DUF3800 domain-containing protein [Acidimicrobiaceae bacterium]|nr:DUF3800 domain-containing protein [Acidimicrobiaceae bacterium]